MLTGPKFYTNKPVLGSAEALLSIDTHALAFQGDAVPWKPAPCSSHSATPALQSPLTWSQLKQPGFDPFFPQPAFSVRGRLSLFSCSSLNRSKRERSDSWTHRNISGHRGGRRTGTKGWRDSQENVTVPQLSLVYSGTNLLPKHPLVISTKTGNCLSGSWNTTDLYGIKFVQRYQKCCMQQLLSPRRGQQRSWAAASAGTADKSSDPRIPGHGRWFIQSGDHLFKTTQQQKGSKARVSNYHVCYKDLEWRRAQLGAKNRNSWRNIAQAGTGPQVPAPTNSRPHYWWTTPSLSHRSFLSRTWSISSNIFNL